MKRLGLKIALGLAGLGAASWIALACSDDPHLRTTAEQARGGGGACAAAPGELPPPSCDDSENLCVSRPGCTIDEARCGSKSTCLPIGDNKGKDVQDFRIRRLKIATPETLAGELIQNTVVTLNIDLAEKSCGELGKGLFTWLLQVDRKNKTLTTGGAPPPNDAIGEGFCFARFDTSNGIKVEPITSKVEFEGDTFKSLEPQKVKIPIFLNQDIGSVILLPISDVRVEGVTISDEGNCIGHFNEIALDQDCFTDSVCSKWTTSGSLGGYITLEEADEVKIRDLGDKSLCAFLAGEALSCARADGKIAFKGDYCSTDKKPGSCADSVWLAATFAASAAKVFDGKGKVPACSGVASPVDAGKEGGTDAGADAADAADGD